MRRNDFMRFVLLWLMVVSLTVLAACVHVAQGKKQREVTIYRDTYGVPHIYAKDTYSLFYGYGYALATDRLFQMEMSKRTVLGMVAEVLGKDYIDFDKSIRSNYSPPSIRKQYDALPKAHKDIFDGYAAGMNARIDEVTAKKELLPREYMDFGFAPCRWAPIDVVMIFVGTMANRFSDFNTEIDNLSLLQYLIT
jgi:penicillin amidase